MGEGGGLASVGIGLWHVLYVSYLVPVERIRPLVPEVLSLSANADGRAFVSVVILKSRLDRMSFVPGPFLRYDQVNVRTYVVDPRSGGPAVFFFRSAVTSRLIATSTRLIGLAWEHAELHVQIGEVGGGLVSQVTAGDWHGRLRIEAVEGQGEKPDSDVAAHLTGPLVGFYGTKRFGIWHPPLQPLAATVNAVEFDLLVEMGLVEAGQLLKPDSVLAVPESTFRVYVPPTRV